jgi:hypothetical protein
MMPDTRKPIEKIVAERVRDEFYQVLAEKGIEAAQGYARREIYQKIEQARYTHEEMFLKQVGDDLLSEPQTKLAKVVGFCLGCSSPYFKVEVAHRNYKRYTKLECIDLPVCLLSDDVRKNIKRGDRLKGSVNIGAKNPDYLYLFGARIMPRSRPAIEKALSPQKRGR